MGDSSVRVDLFGEDRAHETFGRALIERLAAEEGLRPDLRTVSSRGGIGQVLVQLRVYQRRLARGSAVGIPDVLVVIVDANRVGASRRRHDIEQSVDPRAVPRWAIGCPAPHVECWYCADPESFTRIVGAPPLKPRRNDRATWKRALADAVSRGDVVSSDEGVDLGPDLVAAMDLTRATAAHPSLQTFVDDLRHAFRGAKRP